MEDKPDPLYEDAAKELASLRRGRKPDTARQRLDMHLRQLAAAEGLDPKEAAAQIAELASQHKSRLPLSLRISPLMALLLAVLGMLIVMILSIFCSSFVVSRKFDQWRTEMTTQGVSPDTALPGTTSTQEAGEPVKLDLAELPGQLSADGKAEATISVTVQDGSGQPVSNTEVRLGVSPEGCGVLEKGTLTTDSYGKAQTKFTAGTTPGPVTITVRVGEKVQQSHTITLLAVAQPELVVSARAESEQVRPSGQITFVLAVTNEGKAAATGVKFESEIPIGTTYAAGTSGAGQLTPTGGVEWQIGELKPDETQERKLIVNVDPNASPESLITLTWYAVSCDGAQKVEKQESIQVQVAEAENAPSRIDLTVDPSTVVADGKSTAHITARVFDQQGNPAAEGTQVDFELSPPEMGQIDPNMAATVGGATIITFTAGSTTGMITISAASRMVFSSSIITLTGAVPAEIWTLKIQAHLCPEATMDANRLIIYQLPAGTPVQLLGETGHGPADAEFQKVAIEVWLPKEALAQDGSVWRINTTGEKVVVGQTLEDTRYLRGGRTLNRGALGLAVDIVDDSHPDFKKVRIEGWILADSIKKG